MMLGSEAAEDVASGRWSSPPETLALGPDEVHVWRARLDRPPAGVEALLQVLSPDERTRAERFRRPADRARYIVSRGVLRHLLGRYTGSAPAALRFEYGPRGKPALAGGAAPAFNLGHSGDLALVALRQGMEVGVDLERIRPVEFDRIAGRMFAPGEVSRLRAKPAREQQAAFFSCWTCKEAYAKAVASPGREWEIRCWQWPAECRPTSSRRRWIKLLLLPPGRGRGTPAAASGRSRA
ncbi:MAG: 4'-phosphopantetheinyl transferase superfamily protein [Candidatus Rokubacteria bacterium]|nr:4'-phosphopantetheinyl transferase superfamily protein [Candidatus Rokubacteria bacterium]